VRKLLIMTAIALVAIFVVAPRFAPPRFTVPFYQRGGVAPDGVFVPPGKRTVDLVAPLVSWAEGACERRGLPHALIGHSAGGQFLSRVAAFAPTAAKRLVIANAGDFKKSTSATAK